MFGWNCCSYTELCIAPKRFLRSQLRFFRSQKKSQIVSFIVTVDNYAITIFSVKLFQRFQSCFYLKVKISPGSSKHVIFAKKKNIRNGRYDWLQNILKLSSGIRCDDLIYQTIGYCRYIAIISQGLRSHYNSEAYTHIYSLVSYNKNGVIRKFRREVVYEYYVVTRLDCVVFHAAQWSLAKQKGPR